MRLRNGDEAMTMTGNRRTRHRPMCVNNATPRCSRLDQTQQPKPAREHTATKLTRCRHITEPTTGRYVPDEIRHLPNPCTDATPVRRCQDSVHCGQVPGMTALLARNAHA